MNPRGYADPLFILAFDHRGSMLQRFGWQRPLSPDQVETIREAKGLILSAAIEAGETIDREAIGVLVDEEFGATLVGSAVGHGLRTAICVEASGRELFEFEYASWQRHIEVSRTDFVKVLVRYNPAAEQIGNVIQIDRLRALSGYLQDSECKLLLELVIPPLPSQLVLFNGDRHNWVTGQRGELAVESIRNMQLAGIEPDVWKVEGTTSRADYESVAREARRDGRSNVSCIVLGAGAPPDQVRQWLAVAGVCDGFTGFAVGRSIWWDAIGSWHAKELESGSVVSRIAGEYLSLVECFTTRVAPPTASLSKSAG